MQNTDNLPEATLACGDTITVYTVPEIGTRRFCIHCDSSKKVTSVKLNTCGCWNFTHLGKCIHTV